jgi:hypothetical protein
LILSSSSFSWPLTHFSVERSAPRREASRRGSLYGESSQGERGFVERLSPWRNLSEEG